MVYSISFSWNIGMYVKTALAILPMPMRVRPHQPLTRQRHADLPNFVRAVFLDLPAPWEAVAYAKASMARTHLTRICCFSPCMEQVIKTVASLHEHGFTSTLFSPFFPFAHFPSLNKGVVQA